MKHICKVWLQNLFLLSQTIGLADTLTGKCYYPKQLERGSNHLSACYRPSTLVDTLYAILLNYNMRGVYGITPISTPKLK